MEREPELITCKKCGRQLQLNCYFIHDKRCNSSRGIEMVSLKKSNQTSPVKPPSPPPIEKIPCVNCGYSMTLEELDTHPEQCSGRSADCEYCNVSYPVGLIEEHHQVCEARQIAMRNRRRANSMEIGEALPVYGHQGHEDGLARFLRMLEQQRQENRPEEEERHHGLEMLIRMLMRSRNIDTEDGLSENEIKSLRKVPYVRKTEEGDLCTVCYCNFEEKETIVNLACNHMYHEECISKWLKQNPGCPVCKRNVRERSRSGSDD